MTSRILPTDEWGKLDGTELGEVVKAGAMPTRAEIVVVEDGGQIVGCWALMPYYHCEGIFVAESHRGKSSVQRKLWSGMMRLAKRHGATALLTGCIHDRVRRLLEHAGAVKLPGETYILPVGD
jgi:hypothetical protein